MVAGMWGNALPVVLIAWLIGGIPFGYLFGRVRGIDIREHGSGNIGATNVTRVLGKRLGITCFICDAAKGFLPVFVAAQLSLRDSGRWPEWLAAAAVVATVVGHVWTPYLKFRGGKGIATSAGALLAISPLPLVGALIVWLIVFYGSRYVSLASILAAAALPFTGLLLRNFGPPPTNAIPSSTLTLLTVIGVLAIARHHGNIKRLLNGTENRFERKSKKETTLP